MSPVQLLLGDGSRKFLELTYSSQLGRAKTLKICSSSVHREITARKMDKYSDLLKFPLAACAAIAVVVASPNPAAAGILSGYRGWQIELPRIAIPESALQNAEKQKQKYEDLDENAKKTPLVQELLKRSLEKASKNKQQIQDKYCERQAEWGVGDCSLAYSTPEEKEKFLELMKKKRMEESTTTTTTTESDSADSKAGDLTIQATPESDISESKAEESTTAN